MEHERPPSEQLPDSSESQEEGQPQPDQADHNGVRETGLSARAETDTYKLVMKIYDLRVECLKQLGEIRRVEEISSEEELDDHFDQLSRLFRQTWLEAGFPWPPPSRDQ